MNRALFGRHTPAVESAIALFGGWRPLLAAEASEWTAAGVPGPVQERLQEIRGIVVECRPPSGPSVVDASGAVSEFRVRTGLALEEELWVGCRDARGRIVHWFRVAKGGPLFAPATTAGVFTTAVRIGAAGIVVVHNHPSGSTTPSAHDVEFTKTLAEAGKVLDIPVVDHVIVSPTGHYSFLEHGLL